MNLALTKEEVITLTMALDAHYDYLCGKLCNDFMDLEDDDIEQLERSTKRIKALLDNITEQELQQQRSTVNEDQYW